MSCPQVVPIGQDITFSVNTHDPIANSAVDADVVPSYCIYEEEMSTPVMTGSMVKFDDANTTGFYLKTITASLANGFEETKAYIINIEATVGGATGSVSYRFEIGYSPILLDSEFPFSVNTHNASTGEMSDAASVPTYRIYKNGVSTPILTGSMAKLDDANTTGLYSEIVTLSEANGFENYITFTIYIEATVSGVKGTVSYSFTIAPGPRTMVGSEQLAATPASILSEYVITTLAKMSTVASGSAWPLYVSYMPDDRDTLTELGVLYDTSGINDSRQMNGFLAQHFGIQFRIRSRTYEAGWVKIEDVAAALDAVNNVSVIFGGETYIIQNTRRVSPVIHLGTDKKQRDEFTLNLLMTVKKTS